MSAAASLASRGAEKVKLGGTVGESVERMKDADIDYSDIPPLDKSFFTKLKQRRRGLGLKSN